jgi:hypothetical protein
MLNFLIFAVIAVALYFIMQLGQSPWKIRIDAGPQRSPQINGRLSEAQRVQIQYFVQRDLQLTGSLTIYATKEPSGRLLIRIDGEVDPGLRQQIRNFLVGVL